MKGLPILAIAVCIACFFIGYLAYLGTAYIAGFFVDRIDPCQYSIELCSKP